MTITHDDKWWQMSSSDSALEKHLREKKSFSSNVIKDDKYIRRFPSGAVRSDDRGRIKPSFISPYALEEIAKHFSNNENDFGATNYFKGIKPEDVLDSIGRHYLDIHRAIVENDNISLRKDLRALASNCIIALHQIVLEEKELYKEKYNKTEYVLQSEALKNERD